MAFLFSLAANLNAQSTSAPPYTGDNFYDYLYWHAQNYTPDDPVTGEDDEGGDNNHVKRMSLVWSPRMSSHAGNAEDISGLLTAYAADFTYTPSSYNPRWHELGPIGDENDRGNGQIHRITFDPHFNTSGVGGNTFYAASSYGGLWRTEDRGQTYENVKQGDVTFNSSNYPRGILICRLLCDDEIIFSKKIISIK